MAVSFIFRSCNTGPTNAEALVASSKEIELEVNVDKTKYLVMSRDQNAGRSHGMKTGNSSFEMVKSLSIWEL